MFCSLALVLGIPGALIHWLCFGTSRNRAVASNFIGVVPPFFGSVSILFALLTGFLASDIWERDRQAHRAILAEREGLLSLHAISIAAPSDMGDIRLAARRYAEALIRDEWPRMIYQEGSEKAEQELLVLLGRVSDPRTEKEAGSAAQSALLNTVLKLRSARSDRLSISGDQTDRTMWSTVLILAFFTQIAIAIVHLDKPKAQAVALMIFSAAAVSTLGLIGTRERPFDGPLHYSSEPLQQVLQVMSEDQGPES